MFKKKILIIYATNSGGTYVAGEIIKGILSKKHLVVMQKAAETNPDNLDACDVVVLGSPSWDFKGKEGQPHETMLALLDRLKDKTYPGKDFAVYGCGDKDYTYFCGAVDRLEQFVFAVHGEQIVPSLRIDGFYFDLQNNSHLVAEWARGLASVLFHRE